MLFGLIISQTHTHTNVDQNINIAKTSGLQLSTTSVYHKTQIHTTLYMYLLQKGMYIMHIRKPTPPPPPHNPQNTQTHTKIITHTHTHYSCTSSRKNKQQTHFLVSSLKFQLMIRTHTPSLCNGRYCKDARTHTCKHMHSDPICLLGPQ